MTELRALITGANGQLGRALQRLLPRALPAGHRDLDIGDRAAVAAWEWTGVEAIINAAAFTRVDAAETPEGRLDAWATNAGGVANLAGISQRLGIPLVHISSDYVFDGRATEPIPEDTPVGPRSAYGLSKAAGELAARLTPHHCIVRSAWLFGDGPNFVRTILDLARTRDEISVVDDQRGRPTHAGDLAAAIVALLDRGAPPGVYHVTNSGEVVSWARFAQEILGRFPELRCRVRPVSTAEYQELAPRAATRPAYSALALERVQALGITPRDWREALAEYLEGCAPATGRTPGNAREGAVSR